MVVMGGELMEIAQRITDTGIFKPRLGINLARLWSACEPCGDYVTEFSTSYLGGSSNPIEG